MYVNIDALGNKITEKKKTVEEVAKVTGMSRSTFYRKMKGYGLGFSIQARYQN